MNIDETYIKGKKSEINKLRELLKDCKKYEKEKRISNHI